MDTPGLKKVMDFLKFHGQPWSVGTAKITINDEARVNGGGKHI